MRNKVIFVSKLLERYREDREKNEITLKMKGMTPDDKIPVQEIIQNAKPLQRVSETFSHAREVDSVNEKRPT